MSMYRIYKYPFRAISYKHVYIKRNRGQTAQRNTDTILKQLDQIGKNEENLSRAKRHIRDIILCNPFEYFCTFTFNGERINRYNYSDCQKRLSKFFNNFRVRYAPDFRYLVIPEFHKDGAVHFHGVCAGFPEGELVIPDTVWCRDKFTHQLVEIPNTRRYMDWPRYRENVGFFNCSPIQSYERCAMYVTKYVTKDLAELPKGQRLLHGFQRAGPARVDI